MRYLLMTDNRLLAHHFATVCAGRGSVAETPCGAGTPRAVPAQWLTECRPDALLLDLPAALLPRGAALLRQWRARCPGVPVMVVTADGRVRDTVALLRAGADGCHAGGVDARVLAARVDALVRRCQGFYGDHLDCPPFRLALDGRRVSVEGRPLAVTRFEFQVLEVLVRHRGQVLSRADILSRFCPDEQVDERRFRSFNTIYWRLCRRLDAFPQARAMLRNCRRGGFILDTRPAVLTPAQRCTERCTELFTERCTDT